MDECAAGAFAAIFAPVTASSAIWGGGAVVQPSPLPGSPRATEPPAAIVVGS